MAIEQTEQTPSSRDKPKSGYARLRNRHRDVIAMYEALRNDHETLRAAYEQLEGDVQRLLDQHARVMQAVRRVGPRWRMTRLPNWRPIPTLPRCKGPPRRWPNFKTISLR